MDTLTKSFARVAASSAAWGWLHRKSSIKNRKSLCHCERSEAISLHHSLFLVRHSIFTTTFAFLLLLFLIASPAHAKYGGGTGGPNDPYLIFDANQMNAIGADSNDWDKHFKLMADIDLAGFTGTSFNIIGYYVSWDNNKPFSGVFNGNGHAISNFTYDCNAGNDVGLFGYVEGESAVIKDLGLIDPNVDAGKGNSVGSLVGWLSGGTITNCYVEGGTVSGAYCIGGLLGFNWYVGTITNCYSTASVTGDGSVGGLVGENYGAIVDCYSGGDVSGDLSVGGLVGLNVGIITDCYSTANVSGDSCVGGLVGYNRGKIIYSYATGDVTGTEAVGGLVGLNLGTITNCYSTGSTSGRRKVGGLVGANVWYVMDDSVGGTITNCYSTASVSGDSYVGGLVGQNSLWDSRWVYGVVRASFWDTETSGQSTSDGGTGLPTAKMHTASTFISWGCDPVWTIDEGKDYPRLAWENKPGELITIPSGLYGGGSGEPNDPYLIYTAEQLNTIGLIPCHLDKHFILMANIDLGGFTGTSFNIIGAGYYPFSGVFDGNGRTISNFTYCSTYANNIGLFGCVFGENAEIKDLGLIEPNVDAGTGGSVGSLVGYNCGSITNCYSSGSVSGENQVGGLVGYNDYGTITNCYSTGSVFGSVAMPWYGRVGGLVGSNGGPITNCYSTGSISGNGNVGGLVGTNSGTITNCHATGSVLGSGAWYFDGVGGLVGSNWWGTTSNCYSQGDVSGNENIGGLAGSNGGTITSCYSTGSVSGTTNVGGLVGHNGWWECHGQGCWSYPGTIYNCYSAGSVSGDDNVGGLVGFNGSGEVTASFWDIETSGQSEMCGSQGTWASGCDNTNGKMTDEMQTMSTFTDAGWDFNTPVWTIDEGVDYPRLWWELVPVLHAEPEITLGTSNTITWDPVPGANDYYTECAADANFTNILYNSGWITETSCEFTGLELGQVYWYSVKARNSAGTESQWSNVESSLQVTLADAVAVMLDPDTLKNKNMKNALLNKINAVQQMLDAGRYEDALNKLQNDILTKTNGCAETGRPDKNDWIITCQGQSQFYPLVIETIENVKGLMNQ